MTKSLFIQGTSSDSGKSFIVTAICRLLANKGYKVAPFKPFNMSLNSSITSDGSEIARSQTVQAEAARIPPTKHMNPVLLKPTSKNHSQLIVKGKVFGNITPKEFEKLKPVLLKKIIGSYKKLKKDYDFIIAEGSGSPAEINMDFDIANMGVAKAIKSPVVLIGDIERGGVFASLYGTYSLLDEKELVKGFIINRVRTHRKSLEKGIKILEKKTNRPVLCVIPYMEDVIIEEEDTLRKAENNGKLRISVVRLPHISNFTDFEAFRKDNRINLCFAKSSADLENSDLIILPGTKNAIDDLSILKKTGIFKKIITEYKKGSCILGICGGFQMMGKKISDPHGVESETAETYGLSLIEMSTVLMKTKSTHQVLSESKDFKASVKGYEIHMGVSNIVNRKPFSIIKRRNEKNVKIHDGVSYPEKRLWGTYIHGIFDNDIFRENFLKKISYIRKKKISSTRFSYKNQKEKNYDKIARVIEKNFKDFDLFLQKL